jgi:hypothetical protein
VRELSTIRHRIAVSDGAQLLTVGQVRKRYSAPIAGLPAGSPTKIFRSRSSLAPVSARPADGGVTLGSYGKPRARCKSIPVQAGVAEPPMAHMEY